MIKKIAVIGVTVAAIAGTGTAALAATGSSSPTPSATTSPAAGAATVPGAAKANRGKRLSELRRAVHASWVTGDKANGTFTTHQAIRGTVSAVSATSITITAADKTTETFAVTSATKVHTRADHKGAAVSAVKVGDAAFVAGTGTSTVSATQIIDTAK